MTYSNANLEKVRSSKKSRTDEYSDEYIKPKKKRNKQKLTQKQYLREMHNAGY